jgi:hypothetical protein
MKSSQVKVLADKVLKLQTPDKLRFAAGLLEQTNDVDTAIVVIQRALDELRLVKLLGRIP